MPEQKGGIERRKLKRSVARVPISFESGDLRGKGHVKNVSKGGLFVRADALPEPGSEVRVLFHTQQGRKVEIHGIVVWSTAELEQPDARPGFGLRFEGASEQFREFYEQILLY